MIQLKQRTRNIIFWVMVCIGVVLGTFISFLSHASAFNINTFNNSLTNETLTFTAGQTVTRTLLIPFGSILINGYLNLTGYEFTNSSDDTHITVALGSTIGETKLAGVQIIANKNTTVLNVTVEGTAPSCDITDTSNTILASAAVVSGVSKVTYNLTAGTSYRVVCGDGGGYNMAYSGSAWVDVNDVNINMTDQIYDGAINNGGTRNVLNISTVTINPTNLSFSIGSSNQTLTINTNGTIPKYIRTSNLASLINPFLNATYLVGSFYEIPFRFYSSAVGSLNYTDLSFNNSGFIENSQSYNPSSTSGSYESFTINITYDSAYYTSTSATLYYNNTAYPGTKIGSGNTIIYNASFIVPTVTAAINKTFYWDLTLVNGSGTIDTFNSTAHNQSVGTLSIDNCTTNTKTIINYTLYDEDTLKQINGTIETMVSLYAYGTDTLIAVYNGTLNFTTNLGNARICTSDLNTTYSMSYAAKYSTTSYATEHYNGQSITLTNSTATQNVDLYDLLTTRSTAFTITAQGSDLSNIAGAVIDIQRQYLSLAKFVSVEAPLTDTYGKTIGHLVAKDEVYNFIVSKNGVVLGTFNNYIVKCQNEVTSECTINLNIIQATATLEDYENYGNISITYSLDRPGRIVSLSFITFDGQAHNVSWKVIKSDNYGNNTLCINSGTATSGTYSCVIPNSYGNQSFYAQTFSDGLFIGTRYFNLQASAQTTFGGTRVVLAILMYTTLTLLFIGNPIFIVIGSMLGITFAAFFHLIDGGTMGGTLVVGAWFLIAGIIIILEMRKHT